MGIWIVVTVIGVLVSLYQLNHLSQLVPECSISRFLGSEVEHLGVLHYRKLSRTLPSGIG